MNSNICEHCAKAFKTTSTLKVHQSKYHKDAIIVAEQPEQAIDIIASEYQTIDTIVP